MKYSMGPWKRGPLIGGKKKKMRFELENYHGLTWPDRTQGRSDIMLRAGAYNVFSLRNESKANTGVIINSPDQKSLPFPKAAFIVERRELPTAADPSSREIYFALPLPSLHQGYYILYTSIILACTTCIAKGRCWRRHIFSSWPLLSCSDVFYFNFNVFTRSTTVLYRVLF